MLATMHYLHAKFPPWLIVTLLQVQQPISENGSVTGVSYKEGNKWNRNAYQKCNRGKNGEEYGNVCI
jgi:hypothetical protein